MASDNDNGDGNNLKMDSETKSMLTNCMFDTEVVILNHYYSQTQLVCHTVLATMVEKLKSGKVTGGDKFMSVWTLYRGCLILSEVQAKQQKPNSIPDGLHSLTANMQYKR